MPCHVPHCALPAAGLAAFSTAARLRATERIMIGFQAGQRDFSLLQSVQNGSGATEPSSHWVPVAPFAGSNVART